MMAVGPPQVVGVVGIVETVGFEFVVLDIVLMVVVEMVVVRVAVA
jgi:hypothetical protein